jgi:hypothetical protein
VVSNIAANVLRIRDVALIVLQIGGRFNAANVLLAVVGIFTENDCLEHERKNKKSLGRAL